MGSGPGDCVWKPRRGLLDSMRVSQGPRLLAALARELVGHFGVHLTKPAVEFSLQAPGFALPLLVGQTRQRAEVVLQLLHQAVAFDKITVAVHIGSSTSYSGKFQNISL